MRIGSGNIKDLLQDKNSKGFKKLLIDFIKDEPINRNALNSPIQQFRTGAILEEVMYKSMPEKYMAQVRVKSDLFDIMTCTLDFALLEKGKVTYFVEMKTLNFDSFISLYSSSNKLEYVKKYYKSYYNQVQEQMLVTGLKVCTIMFVVVLSDDDNDNWNRVFKKEDIVNVVVPFDEIVGNKILERISFFQQIKDFLCQ